MSLIKSLGFVACGVLLTQTAGQAVAQPGGRGGPGGFDRGMGGVGVLLMSEAVQGEIALEAAQREELEVMRDDIRDEMRDRMRDRFQGFRDMDAEDRQAAMQDLRAEMEDFQADVEKRISSVLKPSQMDRLKQIELQQQIQRGGAQALSRGSVAEKLGITTEQQEQMREKAQEEQVKLQQQIQKLQQESRERVLSVLTEAQRAQLKELTGEQFDMPQPEIGQRGGNRRGQRGGGRPTGERPELE